MKKTITTALLTSLLCACGSSDADVTGRYELEQEGFAEALADKLVELGRIPSHVKDQAVQQLKSARFSLDLAANGTFTASQSILKDRRTYEGTWNMAGTQIRLDQTHENGKDVTDEMAGSLIGGKMTLTHQDQETGGEITMVLNRQSAAAPGK